MQTKYMDFLDLAKKRHSVRKYTNKPVEKEKLDKIIEAAHVAPTAANIQPVKIFVVQSRDGLEKVGKAANAYGAPTVLVVCTDKTKAWKRPFDGMITTDIDASILTDHMMLEATQQGLGTVWICHFKPDVLKEELNIPEELVPVNILAVGYADEPEVQEATFNKQRKPIDELASYI